MRILKAVLLLGSIGVGAVAGLFGTQILLDTLSGEQAGAGSENRSARRETPVVVALSQIESFRETVEAVGSTRAKHSIDVVPLTVGRVDHIAFSGGERVEEGDLLLRLDDRAQRVALREAKASMDESRGVYERSRNLRRQNVTSEAALEQARSAFLRAEAAYERAENDLADREVRAPFAGIVGLRQVEQGAWIDTSTVISSLDDLSEVEIEFSVPESYLPRLDIGTIVAARSDAFGPQTFEGRVGAIDSRISQAARAFKVRATFPNQDLLLRPGMFLSLEVVVDERRSVAVPEESIVSEGTRTFIYSVNDDGRARRIEVSLGLRRGGLVEIRNGIGPQTEVITSGVHGIEHGTAVRRTDPEGTAALAPEPPR